MKQPIFALVDCNNFFVSCERLFRPELAEQPVVVLSSNDGCAVSRSNEAKALGIPMGTVMSASNVATRNCAAAACDVTKAMKAVTHAIRRTFAALLARLVAVSVMPLAPSFLVPYKFNLDQVEMSQEDSICDTAAVEETFGIRLRGFRWSVCFEIPPRLFVRPLLPRSNRWPVTWMMKRRRGWCAIFTSLPTRMCATGSGNSWG